MAPVEGGPPSGHEAWVAGAAPCSAATCRFEGLAEEQPPARTRATSTQAPDPKERPRLELSMRMIFASLAGLPTDCPNVPSGTRGRIPWVK